MFHYHKKVKISLIELERVQGLFMLSNLRVFVHSLNFESEIFWFVGSSFVTALCLLMEYGGVSVANNIANKSGFLWLTLTF